MFGVDGVLWYGLARAEGLGSLGFSVIGLWMDGDVISFVLVNFGCIVQLYRAESASESRFCSISVGRMGSLPSDARLLAKDLMIGYL